MGVVHQDEIDISDRLPPDWKKRVAAYRGAPARHYQRVLEGFTECPWMTRVQRERAAFVIVERERSLEQVQADGTDN